jgi:hypothetical protein
LLTLQTGRARSGPREAIAEAWFRQQQRRMRCIIFDFLAHLADIDAQVADVSVARAPDSFEKPLVGNRLAEIESKLGQKIEFLPRFYVRIVFRD